MLQPEHEDPIHCWQEQTGHESELEAHGLIARLVENCLDSLNCLSQEPTSSANVQSRKDCNALRRCLSLLRLWAKGYGALTGELDALLDRSRNLRQTILIILYPMCKAIAKALRKQITHIEEEVTAKTLFATAIELCDQTRWLLTDINDSSSESESDSDSDASSSEDECSNKANGFVQDIKTYTNCLIDLGPALDCPALEPRQEDTPGFVTLELRSADGYHTELIRAKFPQAKASLLQHLGEASWDRYQRMQKEREVNALEVVTLKSSEKSQIAESEFQDSGIGTSLPQTPSSYAETIVSFMTSISGGQRVNIPPLPAEAKNGLPFECNACGRHIKAASNREWRKHLYADLRPYTCLFERCTFTKEPFANRQLWSSHLELEHGFSPDWHSIECPLCRELTPNGRSAIIIHFSRHMEDIALASLPRDVESEADTDSDASSQLTSVFEPESTSDSIEATHKEQSTKDGVANPVTDPQTEIEQLHNKIEDNFQQLVKLRAATTHARQAFGQPRFDYDDFVNLKAGSYPSRPLKAESEDLRRLVTIQENEMLALEKQIALDDQLENGGLKLPVNRSNSDQDSSRVGPGALTHPTRVPSEAVVLQRHEADPPRPTTPRDAHDWGQVAASSEEAVGPHNQPGITSKVPSSGQFEGQTARTTQQFEAELPQIQVALDNLAAQESGLDISSYSEPRLPEVLYTKTGRISKAKTGLRVHQCDCGKIYTRAAHLRRHQKIHARENGMICKYPTCGKTFYRADLLKRHEERHNEVESRSRPGYADLTYRRNSVDSNSSLFPNPDDFDSNQGLQNTSFGPPSLWSPDNYFSNLFTPEESRVVHMNPEDPLDDGESGSSTVVPPHLQHLALPRPEQLRRAMLPSIQELQLPQQSATSPSRHLSPFVLNDNPLRSTADVIGTSGAFPSNSPEPSETPRSPTIDPKVPPKHPLRAKLLSDSIYNDPLRSARSPQNIGMSSDGGRSQLVGNTRMPVHTIATFFWDCSKCLTTSVDSVNVCPTCEHVRCTECVIHIEDMEWEHLRQSSN